MAAGHGDPAQQPAGAEVDHPHGVRAGLGDVEPVAAVDGEAGGVVERAARGPVAAGVPSVEVAGAVGVRLRRPPAPDGSTSTRPWSGRLR